jgi:hypothetical protein
VFDRGRQRRYNLGLFPSRTTTKKKNNKQH